MTGIFEEWLGVVKKQFHGLIEPGGLYSLAA